VSDGAVTALLIDWRAGDREALDQLMPLIADELRRLARRQMAGERPGHLLQPTALVNEAYLRLIGVQRVAWKDRAHFLAIAARLMRRILVEHARAQHADKRGGAHPPVTFDELVLGGPETPEQIVALDDALQALARTAARKSEVVELRYFGGLTVEETAHALAISAETVMRDWKFAKAWLLRELRGAPNRRA
jgi:RNA polymerase sigma factor (TIGR02999 family)